MVCLRVVPLVAALALVLMATSAEATWSGARSWNKWQCYISGCNRCKSFAPTQCEECDTANGYTLLPDHTCGCASGYGSYAAPASANFPSNPPMCSDHKLYSKHLHSKPWYCSKHYYADNVCQTSPATGSGYCQCLKCPAGYTSTGGPISRAVCTGGSGPITTPSPTPTPVPRGTCKGLPPVAANANPWTRANRQYPCKTHPKLQLLNKNGQCAATCKTGTSPSPTAPLATCVGKNWVITGSCTASGPTAPTCPGTPPAGTNAQPWAADCKDGAAGRSCRASCQPGFEGSANTVCNAQTGWSVTSTCVSAVQTCSGTPPTGENAQAFTCSDALVDESCQAECAPGFKGTADAFCTPEGWDVVSDCIPETDEVTCPGFPEDLTAENALPWDSENDSQIQVCRDAVDGDFCIVGCSDTDNEDRYAYAECSAAGWEIIENTCSDDYDYLDEPGNGNANANANARRMRRGRMRMTKRAAVSN